MKPFDLVGRRFDRLLVLVRAGNAENGKTRFSCQCECGREKIVSGEHLRRGLIKSCGCYRVEFGRKVGSSFSTHRMTDTPEYQVWANMKDRCSNKRNGSFDRYGGRGIEVCDRWLGSFENFLADMGKRPSPNHSLDRWPNNDGNYDPGNCRWATRSQQQKNKNPFDHKAKDCAVRAHLYK